MTGSKQSDSGLGFPCIQPLPRTTSSFQHIPGTPSVLFFEPTLPLKPATIALQISHLAFQVHTIFHHCNLHHPIGFHHPHPSPTIMRINIIVPITFMFKPNGFKYIFQNLSISILILLIFMSVSMVILSISSIVFPRFWEEINEVQNGLNASLATITFWPVLFFLHLIIIFIIISSSIILTLFSLQLHPNQPLFFPASLSLSIILRIPCKFGELILWPSISGQSNHCNLEFLKWYSSKQLLAVLQNLSKGSKWNRLSFGWVGMSSVRPFWGEFARGHYLMLALIGSNTKVLGKCPLFVIRQSEFLNQR